MTGMNLLVQRPLLATTQTIARFASGEENVRTVPCGARELREMAITFNDLADRLARQEGDRLTFLGGIAHDLRNPLAALKMAIDVVQSGAQPPSPEKLERTLAIVARQIERLNRMVGDLLDSTRIESGRLELRRQPLDVRPIVSEVVELYRPVAPAHELVFVEPPEALIADFDPTRIEQVLTNLVSNAVKYSPGGGRVVVTAFAEHSEAIVAVSDEGMGIPPKSVIRSSNRSAAPASRARSFRALVLGCRSPARSSRGTGGLSRSRVASASDPRFASDFRLRPRRGVPSPTIRPESAVLRRGAGPARRKETSAGGPIVEHRDEEDPPDVDCGQPAQPDRASASEPQRRTTG